MDIPEEVFGTNCPYEVRSTRLSSVGVRYVRVIAGQAQIFVPVDPQVFTKRNFIEFVADIASGTPTEVKINDQAILRYDADPIGFVIVEYIGIRSFDIIPLCREFLDVLEEVAG